MPSYGWLLALTLAALAGNTAAAVTYEGTERNCSVIPPYLPSTAVNTTLQLQQLRQQMHLMSISAYIIPGTDAHLSEYIASRDARVAFMTGFTGSAGTAVVTQSKAALWTDSRYWVQAERQMDCNWELEKDVSVSSLAQWLISEVPSGGEIGFDPFLFSLKTQEEYAINLESSNRTLKSMPDNLVDKVWKDRPPIPPDSLTRLPDRVIQRSWQTKVELIRNQMRDNPYEPTALLLSALDETAWLFNMRGNDIPYNPFFYSYTLLTMDEIWVFLHSNRLTDDLKAYLNSSCTGPLCVQLKNYEDVLSHLKTYVAQPGVKVWIGTEYTNYALYEIITPQDKLMTSSYSPVLTTKAVKDDKEQQILRDAHVRDAVAVIQLLMWLEQAVPKGSETELSAAEYVNNRRSQQKDSRGPSFETISASGPNAALAHYSPTEETNRKLTVDEMYLVDSGGQYLDGTTDITRTVHWGTPTAMQREAFTRVLMGNIELSRTIFPSGTRGVNMEMLGRRALWQVGLNYGHGTGHGVGNYFGVHEWPVGFQSNNVAFRAGMFTSIEPGYYKDNDFGIRIEDIVVTVPVNTKYGHNFLTFDTVSLVPYDRKLIDTSLLSSEQLEWLNNYYKTIRELVGAELDKQKLKEEKDWMLKHTEPFSSASVCSSSLTVVALAITLLHNLV
ncbi:xaa-Pro aminopeptidase 2 isoform X8 [Acanthochromis polyacanthus]|uniref:xaa-Pro aminopeptidase 2 isoform X3 n=1 Tax=Acanthochromis polyacanthus TaxID=80966 RepID=UPI0022347408|nr:xaa-Pro aminopeptidase 2 isoform X3 [Acanthochromis polyacanthus]XP_051810816.1 xaa-Pro aminopeptidase 2 isoform X1 [Acanthochromis polyacanthus]XP_051810817.1 xaa-Pro aminopeptidase 2 isoform X2 [Acanthochromis polyacanthus]XP_051810818.1 xaa-Pro aminopeptidase 2 isoform X4 [Acanthochromis polyacanthus]XP_051810819.1 xaa-Pro aminopeptidase 2 isoform X5 [Acanthochromis polyacanthus]XP_051810820.1 xaa-Pro aminopeptidase 2 isoform X6 [Acanthochromis polyacanthus]XP_051810821.1 xaa-Pro aminop